MKRYISTLVLASIVMLLQAQEVMKVELNEGKTVEYKVSDIKRVFFDTKTEDDIQNSLKLLMSNKTSIVIAHRLSTIRNADNILVMKDGEIIEQGTHNKLIKKNGFYAKLYNAQFKKHESI